MNGQEPSDELSESARVQTIQEGDEAPYPNPAYAWYVVGILTVCYTFSFIDRQILNLLVDEIRADLELSDTQISLLQGFAFALFYTSFGLIIGRAADVHSRRAIIGVGVALWSVMTAACGLARSFWTLFAARVGVGVGEAALSPSAYSLITDYFPPSQVTRAIAVYTGGSFLGAGLAYIIGGYVIDLVQELGVVTVPILGALKAWQLAFIAVGLPGLLLAAALITVREPVRRDVIPGSTNKSGRPVSIPVSEVAAYLRSEWKTYGAHFAGFSIFIMQAYAILAWTPTFFIRTFDWTPGEVGRVYGLIILIFGTGGVVGAGWIADHVRQKGHADANLRIIMIAGLLMTPIGMLAYLMPNEWLTIALIIPATFLWSLPHGIAPAALQAITPNQMRAQVSALYLLTVNLVGLGLGPLWVALLTDYWFADPLAVRYSLAIVIGVSAPVSALLLWFGLRLYRETLQRAKVKWRSAAEQKHGGV